jgi:putative addiction module component (TIGR02574 family)
MPTSAPASIPSTYPELLSAACPELRRRVRRELIDGQREVEPMQARTVGGRSASGRAYKILRRHRPETEFAKAVNSPIVSPMNAALATEIRRLTPTEKLQLVEDLWDDLAAELKAVPLTPAQRAELDRRLDGLEKHPDAGRPWSEVRNELLRR